jgi:hypothetical protein
MGKKVARKNVWIHLSLLICLIAGCAASAAPPTVPIPPAEEPLDQGVAAWPVSFEANQGEIEVYQPQPQALKGNMVTARAAVSLTQAGGAAPIFGAASFTARVVMDSDTRVATFYDVNVTDVKLPGFSAAQQQDFAQQIDTRLSTAQITCPLDQLTTSLDTARQEQSNTREIKTDPPHIIFSTTPATLILINGSPRMLAVDGHPGVSRVANTPFIILRDDASETYYIKAGPRWVTAASLQDPWTDATSVPSQIASAGDELATPATQPGATQPSTPQNVELAPAANAKIIVATEPTELIVFSGTPKLEPVAGGAGSELFYATNTSYDLFFDQVQNRYYMLLSGRWYSAPAFSGPWQFIASDTLPAAFAQIPTDSPKANVLAFVAQTTQARAAVLNASIPQTAAISRDAGADVNVAYDGDPNFQDVPECPGVSYALNTPEAVLLVNGRYYCCHQAVWYESAAPTGPWTVSVSVPPVIYTLPPSCPDYPVRYVYVYDSYPDYVVCGYLPGYTGSYIYGSTIVYGTGYFYPGWCGSVYFPPPCTWGFGAYYDPWADMWGFDIGLYWGGPGWFCHPWNGGWWGAHPYERWGWHRWWGPGGFVSARDIRNHLMESRRGGTYRFAGGRSTAMRMPGENNAGPGWHNLYARGGNAQRVVPPQQMRNYVAARTTARTEGGIAARNDVYAGPEGNVFRRGDSGWEEYRGGSWKGVDQTPYAGSTYRAPSETERPEDGFNRSDAGLDRDYGARAQGEEREQTVRSFGGESRGGFRGGGGGRR